MSDSVSYISIDITTPGEDPINHSITKESLGGNLYDPNAIHPVAKITNLSYEFSGRHDTGYLTQLKSTPGHLNDLVLSLQEAKKFTDAILTEKINKFYGHDDEKPPLLPDQGEVEKHTVKLEDESLAKKPKISTEN